METRNECKLVGEQGDEYDLYFNGCDELCIAQGATIIGIGPDDLDPFMRQLNKYVERERKMRKA